mgnify:CR=1 FL=1
MELINTTALPAALNVVKPEGSDARVALVTAKATFRYDKTGRVSHDSEDPFPLYPADEATPLGLLPRDDLPRMDEAFEVILLGEALAPQARPVTAMKVALSVGSERRELIVAGDRVWHRRKDPMPKPATFSRMPLTRERAFGGSAEVLIDVESPVDITYPHNPEGRGFDPGPTAEQLGKHLRCPSGFPKYEAARQLPNIEDPAELIQRWEDTPKPAGWSTIPMSTLQQVERALVVPDSDFDKVAVGDSDPAYVDPRLYHRAHPSWVVRTPPPGAEVRMEGIAEHERVSFPLPKLSVWADWLVGADGGAFELRPQLMVILANQDRFYIVYRWASWIPFRKGDERCVRLRTEEGWYQPRGGQA